MRENAPKKGYALETFKMYWTHLARYPLLLLVSVIFMVATQATALISPLFLREFFNTLVTHTPDSATVTELFRLLSLIAATTIANWTAMRVFFACLVYLDARVMRDIYSTTFDYLIRHSYHFFTNQFAGTLTRRVSRLSKAFETQFDCIIMQFIPTALFVGGAVAILYMRNATLGLALLAWIVVFLIVQILCTRWHHPLRVARVAEDSRKTGVLADAIGNQNTIALFAGEGFERERFQEVVTSWYHSLVRAWTASEIVWGILGLLMAGINIGLLYGALYYWERGLLTVGDFVLIQAYLLTTFERLVSINREIRNFNEAMADAGEMTEILETSHDIVDAKDATQIHVTEGAIAFRDVLFDFGENRQVLKDFNLAIQGGEKVALVGPSGAGKTTVTKLLLRLYDIRSGSIAIDGQDIAHVTQESLRSAIAFVPQEPILFHRTLMENIRYGRRDATDEEVYAAAKEAHCEEFIARTPQGYNTFVGERGIKLSGGERQRIAIARAILKNAPILVLDEATSSLDSESEALIQDALARLMEGKTVIAIAHRLSTVMKMDRIIVIENGQVVTTGTHDELVREEGGLYKKLWSIQAGGFIQDDIEEA